LQKPGINIKVKVNLPGVGRNLQDRYEVGVISQFKREFALLKSGSFKPPVPGQPYDDAFQEWLKGKGAYTTNGALLGIIKRSSPQQPEPDLFIFGLPSQFQGYYPGYSNDLEHNKKTFTWAILKARTLNNAGTVKLRSANPCDVPDIDFHYFKEGSDQQGTDLDAVVSGVEFARSLNSRIPDLIDHEVLPGPTIKTRDQVAQFVQNNAWGHHASCTNKIGADDDPLAVLDSQFRVRGTTGLRVVDASVFPKIPGYFIVSAIYMISEKATDAVLADATAGPKPAVLRTAVGV
jgi:choline dehydrogenase